MVGQREAVHRQVGKLNWLQARLGAPLHNVILADSSRERLGRLVEERFALDPANRHASDYLRLFLPISDDSQMLRSVARSIDSNRVGLIGTFRRLPAANFE